MMLILKKRVNSRSLQKLRDSLKAIILQCDRLFHYLVLYYSLHLGNDLVKVPNCSSGRRKNTKINAV